MVSYDIKSFFLNEHIIFDLKRAFSLIWKVLFSGLP